MFQIWDIFFRCRVTLTLSIYAFNLYSFERLLWDYYSSGSMIYLSIMKLDSEFMINKFIYRLFIYMEKFLDLEFKT